MGREPWRRVRKEGRRGFRDCGGGGSETHVVRVGGADAGVGHAWRRGFGATALHQGRRFFLVRQAVCAGVFGEAGGTRGAAKVERSDLVSF